MRRTGSLRDRNPQRNHMSRAVARNPEPVDGSGRRAGPLGMDPQAEPESPAGRRGRRGERYLRKGVRNRQVSKSILGKTWADVQGEEGIASKTLTTRCPSIQETVTVVDGYRRKCARGRGGVRT